MNQLSRPIDRLGLGTAIGLALLLAAGSRLPAAEEKPYDFKANYTKYEYQIPMRDGVKLFTAVYAPKDNSRDYPIMLSRTPYSVRPYGVNSYRGLQRIEELLAKDGFILVYQDVRGRMGSEGRFVHVRPHLAAKKTSSDIDESTDTYDTIDWLIKHVPANNGRIGMRGVSYPGFYCAAGMIDAHPALKAVSPQAPIADWFVGDDFHHNGAFYLAHAFRFFVGFGRHVDEPTRNSPPPFDYKTPDGYEFYLGAGPIAEMPTKYFKTEIEFWNELMKHGTYDKFWQERDLRPHLKNIRPAVINVGGWFDAEDLFGPLSVYHEVNRSSDNFNMLVMGPWAHGDWATQDGDRLGHVRFSAKTADFYRHQIELPFFKHWLKAADDPKLPEAYVFETGTNQWRRYASWPPANVVPATLYLRQDGELSRHAPDAGGRAEFDQYVSDPARPVPCIPNIAISMTREHMLDDQRFASSRPDVLVYKTDELQDDLTIAGPIQVTLYVSTTGTDSDFVVKLIDVYSGDFPDPDPNPANVRMGSYQQLVRGEAFRGKFRNSLEKPEPFAPGKVTKIEYVMPDAYHTFRRGHKIMVHVQSSWFPLVDRNPQKFVDIYTAKAEDFQTATQRVYRSEAAASSIRLNVLAP